MKGVEDYVMILSLSCINTGISDINNTLKHNIHNTTQLSLLQNEIGLPQIHRCLPFGWIAWYKVEEDINI